MSFEKDAQEAAAQVSARFPGSQVTAQVDGKVVTLTGTAPDVVTKRQIMESFNQAFPKAENVINSIRPVQAGSAQPPAHTPVSAGSPLPGPSIGGPSAAAPSAAPSATAVATARVHVVAKGDTLSAIAKKYYGKAGDYMKIFEANKGILKDPDKIFPGQELKIPD